MNLIAKEHIKELGVLVKETLSEAIASIVSVKTINVGNDANLLGAMILGRDDE